MAARAAKDALELSITSFKFNTTAVRTALDQLPINTRTLKMKMTKLDEALAALNLAHTSWVSKAAISDKELGNEAYSREWLEAQWNSYNTLADQFYEKTEVDMSLPPTKQQTLVIHEKRLESLQLSIQTNLHQLSINTAKELNPSCLHQFNSIVADVKVELAKYEELSNQIINLDPQDLGGYIDQT